MKLNLCAITNPVAVDQNTITGEIALTPVRVERRMIDWEITLDVKVGESWICRNYEPTAEDRRAFDGLHAKAYTAEQEVSCKKAAKAVKFSKDFGLLV